MADQYAASAVSISANPLLADDNFPLSSLAQNKDDDRIHLQLPSLFVFGWEHALAKSTNPLRQ
jgi:hypothetical protein